MSTKTAARPAAASLPAEKSETAKLMDAIGALATDPAAGDRLDRLIALYERVQVRDAEGAFDAAMNLAQAEMEPISVDAYNDETASKYASYAALDRAIRPIYLRHGFSLVFGSAEGAPDGHIRVTCRVAHDGGHHHLAQVDMPADGKDEDGAEVMTRTHAAGSAFTYGQRYLLKLIFNIAIDKDRDGNGASAFSGEYITPEQVAALVERIDAAGGNRQRLLDYLQVDTLARLPKARLKVAERAIEALER